MTEQTFAVADFELENKLTVYPNPAREILNFKTKKEINGVELIDIKGVPMYLYENSKNSYKLPNLNNGTYFLRIYFNDKSVISKKLLII
jgi:hypothetical protein